jgi:hypothetical protein
MKDLTLTELKSIERSLESELLDSRHSKKEFIEIRNRYYLANYNVWLYKNSTNKINMLEQRAKALQARCKLLTKKLVTPMSRSFILAS